MEWWDGEKKDFFEFIKCITSFGFKKCDHLKNFLGTQRVPGMTYSVVSKE
jgi:hypothetical protein